MRIGFLSNQLDNRGTGDALYNYAHYNEEILGNESAVYTFVGGRHDSAAYERFMRRFGTVRLVNDNTFISDVDALYHIKSGYDDGFRPASGRYLVHAVFDNQPHGDRYATISPWMGKRFNLPFVPHIVEVDSTNEDYRQALGIPKDAVVFGRYGGPDTFDIPFVWETIKHIADRYNIYFIFMNTDKPDLDLSDNVIFLAPTIDKTEKKKFINTCDAMLHARSRGETFGISVGEFAISGKPIITYQLSAETAHLEELGPFALLYMDESSLYDKILQVVQGPLVSWGYGQYTPENVMKKFKEVFLD